MTVAVLETNVERRLVDETAAEVWWKLWSKVPFKQDVVYVPEEDRSLLEKEVIKSLERLPARYYGTFCQMVHKYASERNTPSSEFFPGLPDLENVQQKYAGEVARAERRYQQADKLERTLPFIAAGVAFIGGAIAAGKGAEYLSHFNTEFPRLMHYAGHIATAIGGLVGAVAGFIPTVYIAQEVNSKADLRRWKLSALISQDFNAQVEKYIKERSL